MVLSHTPFRQLTHLKDKPVLLAGLGRLKEVWRPLLLLHAVLLTAAQTQVEAHRALLACMRRSRMVGC